MSDRHGERPLTHIDLQDALARAAPDSDRRIDGTDSSSFDNRFPPKRLKKKKEDESMPIELHQQSTKPLDISPTEVHQQSTKLNAKLIAAAPRAPKSPWQTYEKVFDLQLGDRDYYTVAEKKDPGAESNSVAIFKTFTGPEAGRCVQAIRGIQHTSFVNAHLFFSMDDGYLVSFEFMPMALCEVAGNPLLNDLRLASIPGQVSNDRKRFRPAV
ncbi:hypothetical protein IF1G_10848 [Cordyceps javanica]|uniref:Uncharacterized protein n=1 Tax=Cordyceps javanica TaxID=43265 RepID=A0A545UM28_9HYPO|nr:hypothetical protein IF1G_10848 [Cordyceps javanica]